MSKVVSAVLVLVCAFPALAGAPYKVKDLNATDSYPFLMFGFGNSLLFSATATGDVERLYITDGTESGTKAVPTSYFGPAVPWHDRAYFFRDAGGVDVVDHAGSVTHIDLTPPPGGAVTTDDAIFYGSGSNLYRWDGVSTHGELIEGDTSGRTINYLGKTYFATRNSLAVLNGTHADTVMIRDGALSAPVSAGGYLYILEGTKLWRTDGTAGGATLVTTVQGAFGNVNPNDVQIIAAGTRIFFNLGPLYASDGTEAGTGIVISNATSTSPLKTLAAFGDRAVSVGPDDEPWISDGTAAGSRMIRDLQPTGRSHPRAFLELEGRVYFIAAPSAFEDSLFQTDGTETGTLRLTGPPLTNDNLNPAGQPRVTSDHVYFTGGDTAGGDELWGLAVDPVSRLTIDDVRVSEGDAAHFTVSLTHPSTRRITVHYATADFTATAPLDYTPASGNLTFQPGETQKEVSVQTLADSLDEHHEVFRVVLSAASGADIFHAAGSALIEGPTPPADLQVTAELHPFIGNDASPRIVVRNNGPDAIDHTTLLQSDGQKKVLPELKPGESSNTVFLYNMKLFGSGYWWITADSGQRDLNQANNMVIGRYAAKDGNILGVVPAELHPGDHALLEIAALLPSSLIVTSSDPSVLSVGPLTSDSSPVTCTLTAHAPGTATITVSNGVGAIPITVLPAGQALKADPLLVISPPFGAQVGQPFPVPVTLQAKLPYALPKPSGTLTVQEGAEVRAITNVTDTTTTILINPGAVGSHLPTVRYSGDANYNAASASFSYATNVPAVPTITISTRQLGDGTTEVSAFVTGIGTLDPGGSVTINDVPATLAHYQPGVTRASHAFSFGPGIQTIRVNYSGDNNYQPVSFTGTTAPRRRTSSH